MRALLEIIHLLICHQLVIDVPAMSSLDSKYCPCWTSRTRGPWVPCSRAPPGPAWRGSPGGRASGPAWRPWIQPSGTRTEAPRQSGSGGGPHRRMCCTLSLISDCLFLFVFVVRWKLSIFHMLSLSINVHTRTRSIWLMIDDWIFTLTNPLQSATQHKT